MVDVCPKNSEWLYPQGGFLNSLHNALKIPQTSPTFPQMYPVNHPNASHLPKNFHFVGAPSSTGTPSPTGCGLGIGDADAQKESQEEETIDIDDKDTLEPVRIDKRLNWSHEEDIRLVSYIWLAVDDCLTGFLVVEIFLVQNIDQLKKI